MQYIQPNATMITLMSEDVITASFEMVKVAQGTYGVQKDTMKFSDLLD